MRRFLILLTLIALGSVNAAGSSSSCSKFEPLPTDLNSYPGFAKSGEIHLHANYRVNFTRTSNDFINFTLTDTSYLRATLAAHELDIDLFLHSDDNNHVVDSSFSYKREDTIGVEIPAGDYHFQIKYLGSQHSKDAIACHTVLLEFAIVPKATVDTRIGSYHSCPASGTYLGNFGASTFKPLEIGNPVEYDTALVNSASSYNVLTLPHDKKHHSEIVTVQNFTLSSSDLWAFKLSLGYDFLTGGTLRFIVGPRDKVHSCFSNDFSVLSDCIYSSGQFMNGQTINTALSKGNYSVLFYDNTGRKFPAMNGTCTPFQLSLSIRPIANNENYLTCNAQFFPSNLKDEGYLRDEFFLHYRENVFVDINDAKQHSISFATRSSSFFRAVVTQPRLDLRLELVNADDGTVIKYSDRPEASSEVIEADIAANQQYNLTVKFVGSPSAVVFCETLLLEIAMMPSFVVSHLDLCAADKVQKRPAVDTIPEVVSSNFVLADEGPYFENLDRNDAGPKVVVSKNFTVNATATLKASLGANFLLGDMDFYIVEPDNSHPWPAVRGRNYNVLEATLEPGTTYTLVISTGDKSDPKAFLGCLEYSFELSITFETHKACIARRLPSSFNGPEYLGTSTLMHIQERIQIPQKPQFDPFGSETVTFTPPLDSLLRVYTEPHQIDIDFHVLEGSNQIASGIKTFKEESVVVELKAGHNYTLQVLYFYHNHDEYCDDFNLEVAIVPKSYDSNHALAACTDGLPDESFLQGIDALELFFNKSSTFSIRQNGTEKEFLHAVPFTLTQPRLIRAQLFYDFIWEDLVVRIRSTTNEDQVYSGVNDYNKNEIPPTIVPEGSYMLEIYEPKKRVDVPERCITFHLVIGSKDAAPVEESFCTGQQLPLSFSDIAFVSDFNGDMFSHAREIEIDPQDETHKVKISVVHGDQMFRAFVHSPLETVGLNFELKDEDDFGATPIMSTSDGEVIHLLGNVASEKEYSFKQYVSAVPGRVIAPCSTYKAQLAAMPWDYITSNIATDTICTQTLPSDIQPNSHKVQATYNRVLGAKFTHNITFTLTDTAYFSYELRYPFPVISMWFTLSGVVVDPDTSISVTRHYTPVIGRDTTFLEAELSSGTYTLTISDYGDYSAITALSGKCVSFSEEYTLAKGDIEIPVCGDKLPTTMSSDEARPFGGPQNSDGTVHFYGTHFDLPARHAKRFLKYKISEPSFIRVWLLPSSTHDDVDLKVYKHTNLTGIVPNFGGYGWDQWESTNLTPLEAQDEEYTLELYVFKREKETECGTFAMQLVIETNETVYNQLACPVPLPDVLNPPSEIQFPRFATQTALVSDFYHIKSFVDQHKLGSTVREEITLNIEGYYNFFAEIHYDFLTTDFHLELYNKTVNGAKDLNIRSEAGPEENAGWANFESALSGGIRLANGTYTLAIVNNLKRNDELVVDNYCHRFHLNVRGDPVSSTHPVYYVVPSEGHDVSTTEPLHIDVQFSHPINLPTTPEEVLAEINAKHSFYLRSTETLSKVIEPSRASLTANKMVLTLIFPHEEFLQGESFEFLVNTTITTTEGQTYGEDTGSHMFHMIDCQCSGHGQCDVGHIFKCNCNTGYSGDNCDSCDQGYHRQGHDCIANRECESDANNTICHGHGVCTAKLGYPECACDEGWTSSDAGYCSVCAEGYDGVSCIRVAPEEQCDGMGYLPEDLNSIAYLGWGGELHIQDNFYIDLKNHNHEMRFTLFTDSVFRIYVEPHKIDVDLMIYKIVGDTKQLIKARIKFNDEEVYFATLPGSIAGTQYKIEFNYITYNVATWSCESFNMELAIQKKSELKIETTESNKLCGTAKAAPQVTVGGTDSTTFVIPDEGFAFDTKEVYAAPSLATDKGADKPVQLYNFTFMVKKVKHVLFLDVEATYRFLAGDVAMKLVDDSGEEVITGYNEYNTHRIKQELFPGIYSLIVYQPTHQDHDISLCAPYTLAINAEYKNQDETVFNCDRPTLPESLNGPGFINSDGYTHIWDKFRIVEQQQEVKFTLTKPKSLVRIVVASEHAVILKLTAPGYPTLRLVTTQGNGEPAEMLEELEANHTYSITVTFQDIKLQDEFCPEMTFEMAVSPLDPDYFISAPCPTNIVDKLPSRSIFDGISYGTNKYFNGTETVEYYTFIKSPQIKEYTFSTTGSNMAFEFGIGSDFLTSNFRAELYSVNPENATDISIESYGVAMYNYNYLSAILSPGRTYMLRITQFDHHVFGNPVLPRCGHMSFLMNTYTTSDWKSPKCPGEDAVEIPKTLDTIRYMKGSKRSTVPLRLYVPDGVDQAALTTRQIEFSVKTVSVIRVFVDRSTVDIDVSLTQNGTRIASGRNLYDEESFVAKISPGYEYKIVLKFWHLDSSTVDPCSAFSMVVAVLPLPVSNRYLPTSCSPTPAHFPEVKAQPLLGRKTLSIYNYASDKSYFPQVETPLAKEYSVSFQTSFNLYVAVGYDFLTSDLFIKLKKKESDNEVYFGRNTLTSNILTVKGLAAGDYTLGIYEAAANIPEIRGCVHFRLEMSVEPYDANGRTLVTQPKIPTNLNVLPYLDFTERLHVVSDYITWENGERTSKIKFKLPSPPEVIRVAMVPYQAPGKLHVVAIVNDTNNHFIYFTAGNDVLTTGRTEISMAPENYVIDTISKLESQKSCSQRTTSDKIDPIHLSPQGYYTYSHKTLILSKADAEKNPEPNEVWVTIQSLPFTLEQSSVFFAKIGYEFLLGEFQLSLHGGQLPDDVIGRNGWNTNTINTIIPAGEYILDINLQYDLHTRDISYCPEFFFALTISGSEGRACTAFNQEILPWDLFDGSTAHSEKFGGPVIDGFVHIHGPSFALPQRGNEYLTQQILFNARSPSIFTALTSLHKVYGNFEHKIISHNATGGVEVIQPVTTTTAHYQRLSIFYLEPNGNKNYTLELVPTTHANRPRPCPYFAMDLMLESVFRVDFEMCKDQPANSKLPLQQLTMVNGQANETVESFMTPEIIAAHTNGDTFDYVIEFNITEQSHVDVELSYNGMTNAFYLELEGGLRDLPKGLFSEEATSGAGVFTTTQEIGQELYSPGLYKVHIKQDSFNMDLGTTPRVCFPFYWSIAVSALSSATPTIEQVLPPAGEQLDPTEPITLEVILSNSPYTTAGEQITRRAHYDTIVAAFSLESRELHSHKIKPTIVPAAFTGEDDFTVWHLLFVPPTSTGFVEGHTYELSLDAHHIQSEAGKEFVLQAGQHIYSMRSGTVPPVPTASPTGVAPTPIAPAATLTPTPPQAPIEPNTPTASGGMTMWIIIISAVIGALIFIAAAIYCCRRCTTPTPAVQLGKDEETVEMLQRMKDKEQNTELEGEVGSVVEGSAMKLEFGDDDDDKPIPLLDDDDDDSIEGPPPDVSLISLDGGDDDDDNLDDFDPRND